MRSVLCVQNMSKRLGTMKSVHILVPCASFVVPRRMDMCFVHKARIAYFSSFYDEQTCADNHPCSSWKKIYINDPDPQCTAHPCTAKKPGSNWLEEMDGPAECSEIISFEHQNKSKTKYNFNLGVALHLKLIFNICRGQ